MMNRLRKWKRQRLLRGAWWWRSYTVESWVAGRVPALSMCPWTYCVLARRPWWRRPRAYLDAAPQDNWHEVAAILAHAIPPSFPGYVNDFAVYDQRLGCEQVESHYAIQE